MTTLKRLVLFVCTLPLLLLTSCKNNNDKSSPDILPELKYAAFFVCTPNEFADTNKIYFVYGIDIDKNGHYTGMRHINNEGKHIFFSGSIGDTLRQQIYNLKKSNLKSEYYDSKGRIYCGPTYLLDYIDTSSRKTIFYDPPNMPNDISCLSGLLDTLIFHSVSDTKDSFAYAQYSEEIKTIFLSKFIVVPHVKPTIKFNPPRQKN